MASNSIDEIRDKIRRIQRRRAILLNLREMCLALAGLAAVFAVLSVAEMIFQLPPAGRIALTGVLAAAAGIFAWRFIHIHRKMDSDDRRVAHYVDEQAPQLEQRLMTSLEFAAKKSTGGTAALVKRLWQDTLVRLQDVDLGAVSSIRGAWPAAAAALVLLCSLLLAARLSTEFSLAARRIITPWGPSVATADLPVGLRVAPGDIKIQRGSDVLLVARTANVAPKQAAVYLQTGSQTWDRVAMRPEGAENTFAYFLASVQKDVIYYVDIGIKQSDRYTISVVDVPRVDRIAVDYVYPEHTGLKNRTVKRNPHHLAGRLQQGRRSGCGPVWLRHDPGAFRRRNRGQRFFHRGQGRHLHHSRDRHRAAGKRKSLRVFDSVHTRCSAGGDPDPTRPGPAGDVP
jgi:hypothetical protein